MSVFEDGWEHYGSPLFMAGSIMARRLLCLGAFLARLLVLLSFDAWEHGWLGYLYCVCWCLGAVLLGRISRQWSAGLRTFLWECVLLVLRMCFI